MRVAVKIMQRVKMRVDVKIMQCVKIRIVVDKRQRDEVLL